MKWFMVKAFLFVSLMFVAVLFGMQQAHEGIQNMKGFDDAAFKSAFTLQEKESGEYAASILGNEVSSHDIKEKQRQLEEMKAYNFFSSIGKKLSDGVTSMTEKSIDFMTELLKEK
ncbi:YqxA family protein [Bacillus sp. Bva_UNVM-123]